MVAELNVSVAHLAVISLLAAHLIGFIQVAVPLGTLDVGMGMLDHISPVVFPRMRIHTLIEIMVDLKWAELSLIVEKEEVVIYFV